MNKSLLRWLPPDPQPPLRHELPPDLHRDKEDSIPPARRGRGASLRVRRNLLRDSPTTRT